MTARRHIPSPPVERDDFSYSACEICSVRARQLSALEHPSAALHSSRIEGLLEHRRACEAREVSCTPKFEGADQLRGASRKGLDLVVLALLPPSFSPYVQTRADNDEHSARRPKEVVEGTLPQTAPLLSILSCVCSFSSHQAR